MKPVFYISGPMTGICDLNFPEFHSVAARLRSLDYLVVNPAELNPIDVSWSMAMRNDIAALMQCTDIVLLPGYKNSKGSMLELHIAESLGMTVHFSCDIKGATHGS